jgi:hypothetical protein
MRVFCSECAHVRWGIIQRGVKYIEGCDHPNNLRDESTVLERVFRRIKRPSRLNKNNNCSNFSLGVPQKPIIRN